MPINIRDIASATSSALLLAACIVVSTASFVRPAGAQAVEKDDDPVAAVDRRLNVFLDCDVCDFNYIRREITFVNHVREREEADVHVLVTRETAGSGGRRYTFDVLGRGPFEAQDFRTGVTTFASDSEDEERSKVVRSLQVALSPYLLQTPLAEYMSVDIESVEELDEAAADDPWNGWTVEIYGDGYGDVEATQSSLHLRYGVYVDRVTETWRIRLRPYFNYNLDTFEDDGDTIRSESRRDGFDSYLIRSISQHWSIGLFADAFSSTYDNIQLRLRGSPAIEYSVFPYREASRRELTVAYHAGISHVQYRDTTIFDQIAEMLPQHIVDVEYDVRQTWGSIDVGLEASQYLHDLQKYSLGLGGGVSVRLTRGLSLRLSASGEFIHDQLNLARGDASLEEVLLRRRQLATDFEFEGSIGFRYRFGSIYSNVVNTRL